MASERMNEWLAEAYGTNGAGRESDIEKTAQALMLNKLGEQEGIDLSGLDEQQLALLAQEVSQQMAMQQQGGQPQPGMSGPGMPPAGGMPPMGAPPPQAAAPMTPPGAGPSPQTPQGGGGGEGGFSEEQIKVAQAKMAEADFIGRMMAHALHQELNIIKQAEFPNGGGSPFQGNSAPESDEEKRKREEEEAEKTATAYLAARGYSVVKQASAEGPLTRAIRALGGTTR